MAEGVGVVVAGVVQFLDAGEDEDLVVHRQPEGDDEQQHGHGDRQRAGVEAEQAGQVAVLEDPDGDAEHRGEANGV